MIPRSSSTVRIFTLETESGTELDDLARYKQLQPEDPGLERSQIPVVVTNE